MVFCIITLSSVADLTSSEIDEVSENSVDKDKIEKFNNLIRTGDSIIWKNGQYTPEIIQTIDYYKKALDLDSSNQETLFKIAYLYDAADSVTQAKKYYDKIDKMTLTIRNNFGKTEYPEIDVKKIKDNFNYSDSIEIIFKKYGKKSSITFDYDIALSYPDSINIYRIDSYLNKIFNKKIYFTVYGNGEFVARKFDYTCDCKLSFKGILPDSILVKILKTLGNSRILSLKKIFFGQDTDNNDYYIKSHKYHKYSNYGGLLYSEVTNIETPLFSHIIEIVDLDDYSNDKMLSLCLHSDINLIYNPTFPDKEEAKLEILNELWKYIFCTDFTYRYDSDENLTDDEILNDFDSHIKIADENLTYNDTITLNNAIQNYKKALLIRPNDQGTLFKIAYLYDLSDSVTQAKKYYDKINVMKLTIKNNFAKTEYPEIDVKKIKDNLKYNDSLVNTFKKYGKKSSITLDYYYSNDHKYILYPNWFDYYIKAIFYRKIYFTIYGNGEFEARTYDFKTDSKNFICGTLPDSILCKILSTIENGRILSLKKLFEYEESEINRFYGIRDIIPPSDFLFYPNYFERFTIKSPEINHSIKVLNLVDSNEDKIFSPRSDSTINLNYNNTLEDKIRAKLQLLSELWKYIYCIDLTKYSTE